MKCPKDGGDLAVRKTKRGDTFYGCVNYPKCDFSSNLKLVDEQCPLDHAAYLVEYCEQGRHVPCLPEQPRVPAQAQAQEGRTRRDFHRA